MINKVFVSYKYYDTSVYQDSTLDKVIDASRGLYAGTVGYITPRSYLNELSNVLDGYVIEKWEQDGEDLSDFSNNTIASKLRDKIYDSSITIVLISPNMKDKNKKENQQWIPWEISYSLCEYGRNNRISRSNALVAIVLPDVNNSYNYCIEEKLACDSTLLKFNDGFCFEIIAKNFFNKKDSVHKHCNICNNIHYMEDDVHYTVHVKWCDFKFNPKKYLNLAIARRENIDLYNITKTV